jgi:excisionase family DNA binding protein
MRTRHEDFGEDDGLIAELRDVLLAPGGLANVTHEAALSTQIFYTPAEVALICRVTRRTVYTWIKSQGLYARRAGPKQWLISKEHLLTFLGKGIAAAAQPKDKQLSAQPKPVKNRRRG